MSWVSDSLQAMVVYTPEQRWFITSRRIRNMMRVVDIQRSFTTTYGIPSPSRSSIFKMTTKLNNEYTLQNLRSRRCGRKRSTRSFENTTRCLESVTDTPKIGQRPRAALLGIPRTSLQRIMKLDLGFKLYHIQRKHKMVPNDHTRRVTFANDFIRKHNADEDFLDNIWYSDESHIHLDGYVNSRNAVYWGTTRPTEYTSRSLHPTKVTIWAAISSHGILGPYFFTGRVNGGNYLYMLTHQFYPDLRSFVLEKGLDFTKMYFMQDGARAHIANPVFAFLNRVFSGRVIGERFQLPWPARSPDLTPCDFFLWGWLKDQVYKELPIADGQALRNHVIAILGRLPTEFCKNTSRSVVSRLQHVSAVNGDQFEHLR